MRYIGEYCLHTNLVTIISYCLVAIVQYDMKPYRFSVSHCWTKLTCVICSTKLISMMTKVYIIH